MLLVSSKMIKIFIKHLVNNIVNFKMKLKIMKKKLKEIWLI